MKNTIKIMVATLVLVLVTSMTTATAADAAKKKTYTTKTIKVTSGKSKTVTTTKKIKKVTISSTNKNFSVKKTENKKFKVSGTDKGKSQTVKVTYTNKYTQKFKIKTVKAKKKPTKKIPSYAQKIVNELKPLLADPDKGLQTVLNQWLNKKHGSNSSKYEPELRNMDFDRNTISKISLDEVMRTYTPSQKKALILEVYFRQRMTYSMNNRNKYCNNRNSNTYFKKLYNGTFKGVCADGAKMGYDICQYLGIKSKYTGSMEDNHGWCAIYVTDKNKISYWHGIYTTSDGYNLKGTASIPTGWTMTKKQVMSYTCKPNEQTHFVTVLKRASHKPAVTAAPPSPSVTTQAPVQTPAPQATPTPKPSPTTTTVIFNTPEPPEPEETETPVATTEPTKVPVVTQEPTVKPTPAPAPTETPVPQRIVIPYNEHGYTCPGCDVSPYRHKSKTNPYISNFTKVYGNYTVYEHNCNGTIRYFDADGNEYIDINRNSDIMDEIVTLAR